MQLGWAGKEWMPEDHPGYPRGPGGAVVASYHTNLPTYATLFGFPWLEPVGRSLFLELNFQYSTTAKIDNVALRSLVAWQVSTVMTLCGPFGIHRRS